MEGSVIYQRIYALCSERGITISKLEKEIGVAVATIQKWQDSKRSPSVENVGAVAQYFNVSIEYLLGTTDVRSTIKQILSEDDGVISLQRAMEKMTPVDKSRAMAMLRAGYDYAFREDSND